MFIVCILTGNTYSWVMKKFVAAISLSLLSTAAMAASEDPSIAIAQLNARISNLEEVNRRLAGKIDELQHEIDQQNAAQAVAPQAQPVAAAPTPVLGQTPNPLSLNAADGSTVTKPNPYVTKVAPPVAQPAPAPEIAPAAIQPASDKEEAEEDEFDKIFKSVAAEDYKTAKPALKAFIEKYPNTDLAGEAYFWLGEISWSQRNFNDAAINYLKGYKEAPTGEKAPENILKMALTLKELKKNTEACKYISRFETEFPNAHEDLKAKAASAKVDIGCK